LRNGATILLLLLLAAGFVYGQAPQKGPANFQPEKVVPVERHGKDSSVDAIMFPVRTNCKASRVVWFETRKEAVSVRGRNGVKPAPAKRPLLVIHGNIMYDFDYWSNIDTPYAERNINQQTLQTYLDVDYKEEYPVRVVFTTRWSNSALFRNMTDVSVQYNARQFNNRVRKLALGLLFNEYWVRDSLQRLEKELNAREKEFNSLNSWVNGPDQQQRLMTQRELAWLRSRDTSSRPSVISAPVKMPDWDLSHDYGAARHGNSSGGDSGNTRKPQVDSGWLRRYDSLQRRLDSLGGQLDSMERKIQVLRSLHRKGEGDLQHELDGITSGKELKEKLQAEHVPDSSLPKGYSTLYSIRSLGVGRSLLNYSELSAKNVSINGLEVEYNPKAYMAFAAGTVDYRFRDYTINDAVRGQYLAIGRYGWGKKDGNNVIFTYYTGRRQLYNVNTSAGTDIPNYNLMGFTVQGCYKLFRTTSVIAEVAKSSLPYYSLDSSRSHDMLGSTLKLSDRSNEAYSLKVNSLIPKTQTQLSATYSRFGANFQSFSLFTTGSQQSAWSLRVDQPFLQRHLLVTASVRTNDFVNPLLTSAYSSTAVFESFQATLRLKKWPVLSFGYFPSSQIVRLGNGNYQENLFYTMTATASESYKVKGVTLLSMLLYTRFYNKITDTGFIYFNTSNLVASQMAMIGRITAQLQLSLAANAAYTLYVADAKLDYRVFSWLSLGAGVKYNDQTVFDIRQWGYSLTAGIRVRKIGEIRGVWDEGFIPGNNKRLVPNDLGRITYTRIF